MCARLGRGTTSIRPGVEGTDGLQQPELRPKREGQGEAGEFDRSRPGFKNSKFLKAYPDDPDQRLWRCSGSLIAEDLVLTAGHCTDGAMEAHVWFVEKLQAEDGSYLVPDYPEGGVVAIKGTPYTNPDYRSPENPYGGGNGLPAFSYRDVGVVVLNTEVTDVGYAQLPSEGLVDTLKNKTPIDFRLRCPGTNHDLPWPATTG